MYVVLIETSGNQDYIFATNKLRENVGASELTYQVGTKFVIDAVGRESKGRKYDYKSDEDGNTLREILLNETPIEKSGEQDPVEIIIATSGKALLLTKTSSRAEELIRKVTIKALEDAPGLTVHGAIQSVQNDLSDIHDAIRRVHHKLENLRYRLPSNQQRFLRMPHIEPCATSGLPAQSIRAFEPTKRAYSEVSLGKRRELLTEFDKGRISKMLERVFEVELPRNLEKFEEVFPNTKWLAVIHADGNGLGQVFLRFREHLGKTSDGRSYIDAYRKFSISLDICTVNAAGYAIKNLQLEVTKQQSQGEVPVIPLVLGGDDLTVLCDGEYAIKFTRDFLEQFERETNNLNKTEELKAFKKDQAFTKVVRKLGINVADETREVIPFIASRAFGVERLATCAGVAIVKPHYPFHQAYDLAEELLQSAKLGVRSKVHHTVNKEVTPVPCSAIDFHVLYDSRGVELADIRKSLQVDHGGTYLYAKPYIVTPIEELKKSLKFEDVEFTNRWLNSRTWNQLEERVCAISAEDEDSKRKLPNSQMHHIRESLHRGKGETDSEVELFSHRYRDQGFKRLLAEEGSLFFKDDGENGTTRSVTHFLDALDVVDFWKGFECQKEKNTNGPGEKHQDGGVQ